MSDLLAQAKNLLWKNDDAWRLTFDTPNYVINGVVNISYSFLLPDLGLPGYFDTVLQPGMTLRNGVPATIFNGFNLKGYKLGLIEVYAATWESATKDILGVHPKGFGDSFADVVNLQFTPQKYTGTGLGQSGDLVFTMAPGNDPGFTLQLPNQLDTGTNKPDIDKVAMIFNSDWVEKNAVGQLLPVKAGTTRYQTIMH